ncbi:hypothetical protein [Persicobacter sp. CCB-QB2]|uniref:hypothetical protein n=1 Tax=Persicobacter sp. CCB-QB2 TaxID=1561025 RepID=UPI0006A9E3BB|nr:hypothetical protein [Persicobacter sp. CCB-QB2]
MNRLVYNFFDKSGFAAFFLTFYNEYLKTTHDIQWHHIDKGFVLLNSMLGIIWLLFKIRQEWKSAKNSKNTP